MTPMPLLTTKLYTLPHRATLVRRPRVTQHLDHSLRQGHLLTLVCAPAGYGKTTLIAEWLNQDAGGQDPPARFAWLSLDPEDNNPARFFAYLIAALQKLDPTVGLAAQNLLETPQLPPVGVLMTLLVNDLAAVQTRSVLVLDDYHAINAPLVHEAVEFFIAHRPPYLGLVIATRQDPPLSLARLRVRGQLTEIRADELRFTLAEAAAFFQAMQLNLGVEAVKALEARTEGWIAGLQLAALSVQGWDAPRIAEFVTTFSGSHRYVIDYLVEEVLYRQSDEVRNFLCQTAVLDRLCAGLADAVTGRTDGQMMLHHLEQANLFLVPLDDERCWYRYHHLFGDSLRQQLRRTRPELINALHLRASEWFDQNKRAAEAIHHAMAASDFERAADLVERGGTAAWARADVNLFKIIGALPREIVARRPWLGIFHAWSLQITGQLGAVESYFQDAEAHLSTITQPDEVRAIRSYTALIRAFLLEMSEIGSDISPETCRGIEEIPDRFIAMRYGATWVAGFVYYLNGDFATSTRYFMQAIQHGEATGIIGVIPICLAKVGAMGLVTGRLHETAQIMEDYLHLVNRAGSHTIWLAGFLNLNLGQILIERNDLACAAAQIEAGCRNLELWQVPYALALAWAVRAELRLAQGDLAGTGAALTHADEIARRSKIHPDIRSMLDNLKIRLLLASGDSAGAARFVQKQPFASPLQFSFRRELDNLTLARVWLAQGKIAEADELLVAQAEAARSDGRTGRLIQILVLRALVLAQSPGTGLAPEQPLAEALALAQPEGYCRTFLAEGEPMRALLQSLHSKVKVAPPVKTYIQHLLEVFTSGQTVPPPSPSGSAALVDPLSERELEVLRMLAEGKTNPEIAQALVIEVGTVKAHNTHIFDKLEVKNRAQAIIKARKLGLI